LLATRRNGQAIVQSGERRRRLLVDDSELTKVLREYIAASQDLTLPIEVQTRAKQHILDTFAAMISGSRLKPGQFIRQYVRAEGSTAEAQVVGSALLASASLAALANGTAAHADETDDSHAGSGTHPGCAVVSAALAMAERSAIGGTAFLKAVVAGYDVGCRVGRALQPAIVSAKGHSSRSLGNVFGATAAAASVARLDVERSGCALSYAAQQAAGIGSYIRAQEHIEKAFVLGGMPARNGVMAARLGQIGVSGTADPFVGERNFLRAYSPAPQPEELVRGLGVKFEILETSIKQFCVGSPVQAPLEALLAIMAEHPVRPEDVERVVVRVPAQRAATVNDRAISDINLQHLLAVAVVFGKVTFAAAHAESLWNLASVRNLRARIELIGDPALDDAAFPRQVRLTMILNGGSQFEKQLITYRGTPENPASNDEIEAKARELLEPVIGREQAEALIRTVGNLETVADVRELRSLMAVREE
jgi:2-methylcitrate dehydratase PrpD